MALPFARLNRDWEEKGHRGAFYLSQLSHSCEIICIL
jgi:hypothetical protein